MWSLLLLLTIFLVPFRFFLFIPSATYPDQDDYITGRDSISCGLLLLAAFTILFWLIPFFSPQHLLCFATPILELDLMKLFRSFAFFLTATLTSAVYTDDVVQYCTFNLAMAAVKQSNNMLHNQGSISPPYLSTGPLYLSMGSPLEVFKLLLVPGH